jgi:hypothetical protein
MKYAPFCHRFLQAPLLALMALAFCRDISSSSLAVRRFVIIARDRTPVAGRRLDSFRLTFCDYSRPPAGSVFSPCRWRQYCYFRDHSYPRFFPPVLSFDHAVGVSVAPHGKTRNQVIDHCRFVLDQLKLEIADLYKELDQNLFTRSSSNKPCLGWCSDEPRQRAIIPVPGSLPDPGMMPRPVILQQPIGPPTIRQYLSLVLLEKANESLYWHSIDRFLVQISFVLHSYSPTGYRLPILAQFLVTIERRSQTLCLSSPGQIPRMNSGTFV